MRDPCADRDYLSRSTWVHGFSLFFHAFSALKKKKKRKEKKKENQKPNKLLERWKMEVLHVLYLALRCSQNS